jgi:glycosyltransferase involved in cell wall biosynthesis
VEEPINPEEPPCATGWNLIGLLDHRGGLGNAARTNIQALKELVGSSRRISYPSARYPADKPLDLPAIHGINYLHFNPCSVGAGLLARCPWFVRGRNIGYWAWETTRAPERWLRYDEHMAQIWVPSQFVKTALIDTGFKTPVYVIPHAIAPQRQHEFPAADKPLTFMVQFDHASRISRKRPDLSLQAIQRAALRSGEKIRIIIKTHRNETVDFAEYPNIQVEIINEWLSDAQMDALWNRVDIFVSLNRGEGFGLPMAEAMARGIPVVATSWGAVGEFLDEETGYPVGAEKIEPCTVSCDAYFTTGDWALPSVSDGISQVQAAMHAIRNGYFQTMIGWKAHKRMKLMFSTEKMKERMTHALKDLC